MSHLIVIIRLQGNNGMYLKYILRENPWINIEEYNRNILIFLDVNGILSTTKFTIVVNKSKEKSMVGLIIYLALGYWAVGETIYKNKILFSTQTGRYLYWKVSFSTYVRVDMYSGCNYKINIF